MALKDEQKLDYYKNKEVVEQVILDDAAEDGHVIYGARAINAQVPAYLNKHTDDFDIFVKNPKKEAIETEKKLDRAFGGDLFRVEKGKYPATWKVKSNVTNKTVADYTYKKEKIKTSVVGGNKYASIKQLKKMIKRTLGDKKQEFRHKKDSEALQRIKLAQGDWLWQ